MNWESYAHHARMIKAPQKIYIHSRTLAPRSEWTWEKSLSRVASQSWSARKKPKKKHYYVIYLHSEKIFFLTLTLVGALCFFFGHRQSQPIQHRSLGEEEWIEPTESASMGAQAKDYSRERRNMRWKRKWRKSLSYLFWSCRIYRNFGCVFEYRPIGAVLHTITHQSFDPRKKSDLRDTISLMEWKLIFFRVFVDFQSNTHRTSWPSDQRWHKCDTTLSNISFFCVLFFFRRAANCIMLISPDSHTFYLL